MRSIMKKWTNLLASALLLFFFSCNEMDKYYDNERHSTSVSVGNAWEYLENRGNFTNFLRAAQRAGYEDLVRGKGLATIFAPDDEAFAKYLSRHGYSSVEEIPVEELQNMVTYHLLYYSFRAEDFMEYRPEGTNVEDDWIGLYFKYRTRSRDAAEMISDPSRDGALVKVFHQEKYIPVFTPNLFNYYNNNGSSGSSGAINYDYFYGSGLWQGDNWVPGNEPYFRVSNAGVKEYEIITDNGYLYVVDDVVEPLKTMYQAIAADDKYSIVTSIYDRFRSLNYDEVLSMNYNNRDSAFVYKHKGLSSIAYERVGVSVIDAGNTESESYYLGPMSIATNTLFAPQNAAMQAFYDKYWAPYYGTNNWDSVRFTPLYVLMSEFEAYHRLFTSYGPLLPSEISAGNAMTWSSRSRININPDEIQDRYLCSNGIVYGVDQLISVPQYFYYVTAPAFVNPKYNMFMLLMAKSGVIDLYTAANQQFHAFYPTQEMLEATSVGGETLIYENTNPKVYGAEDVIISDGEGGTVSLSMANSANIVRNQIADDMIEIPGTNDRIYYLTSGSFNYLFSHEDTIYSTTTYNTRYGLHGDMQRSAVTFKEMTDIEVRNGHVYGLEGGSLASALLPESRTFQSLAVIEAQVPWEFKETVHGSRNFYQSGILSSLSDSTENVEVFIAMEAEGPGNGSLPRYIVLAPNNQAVQKAYDDGFISARGSKKFKGYMPNLFISVERSRLLDYPMPGDGQGTRTLYSYNPKEDGTFTSVQISDMGSYLQITDTKGRTARVVNSFPYIYNDCAVYIIDNYLDFGDGTYVVQ